VGPARLFESRRELLPLVVSSDTPVSCCQMVYLARLRLTRVPVTLLDMSDTCPMESFSSNSTFIMLYLYLEMVSTTW
jgi:hypothetical protein